MQNEMWIEKLGEDQFALVWTTPRGKQVQPCSSVDEARAFAAGLERGFIEARNAIADCAPRFDSRTRESGK